MTDRNDDEPSGAYRARLDTLPEPMTESHEDLDPKVRVRSRTAKQEYERRETIKRWLGDPAWTERLLGRMYDLTEEQISSNVRTSRLERHRELQERAMSELDNTVRTQAVAVMRHVDKANVGRRRIRLREVAVLVIALAGAVAAIVGAVQGRHVELPAIDSPRERH